MENLKAVEYEECDKEELLKDFDDYIAYLADLKTAGEYRTEQLVSKPDLSQVKRIFCSRGCTATHYTNGQCFLWNSPERINYQRIYRLAQKEPAYCKGYNELAKRLKEDRKINYDWKATEKSQNYKNESWQSAGEGFYGKQKRQNNNSFFDFSYIRFAYRKSNSLSKTF